MMEFLFNDQKVTLPHESSLEKFLAQQGVEGAFAIAINEQFVPKSLYGETQLQHGDRIDLVKPMQGG